MYKNIEKLIESYDLGLAPGVAIAIAKEGKIIFTKEVGYADLNFKIKIEPITRFHIASASKQFTALSFLMAADEKNIDLDAKACEVIEGFPKFENITLKNLMHHTSGIADLWETHKSGNWRKEDVLTHQDLLKFSKKQKHLNFEPGDKWIYSNTGYVWMAEAVKQWTGLTLREYTQKYIIEPYGLKDTTFDDNYRKHVNNLATSYMPDGEGGYNWMPLLYQNCGATGIATTASDLALWGANYSEWKVGRKHRDNMLTSAILNDGTDAKYGGGLMFKNYHGSEVINHTGSVAAFRSSFSYLPKEKLCIAVITNLGTTNAEKIAWKAAYMLLNPEEDFDETEILTPVKKPAVPPEFGIYYNVENLTVEIEKSDDGYFAYEFGQNSPLEKLDEYTYMSKITKRIYQFEEDGFILNDEPNGKIQYKLLKRDIKGADIPNAIWLSEELNTSYELKAENSYLILDQLKYGEKKYIPMNESEYIRIYQNEGLNGAIKYDAENDQLVFNGGRIRNLRFDRINK